MKFTKEEAFESLKGILTNNGKKPLRMSEKSIEKQLEALMPLVASDEMELNDFVDKVKVTFSTMNSNAEKDNSDFIKQWEKEHPVVEPNQGDGKGNQGGGDDAMSKLMSRLEELEKREAERQSEVKISKKRKDLEEAMEKKGIKDKSWRNDFLSEIAITEDMDVEAKADSFLKIYNKSKADTGDGTTPYGSSKGGDNNNGSSRFDYIKKQYEKEHDCKNV